MELVGSVIVSQLGIACEVARSPELAGAPLALVSSDKAVKVASPEAAKVGVTSGQPLSAAKLLCPRLLEKPYDGEHYLTQAENVWNLVAVETSFVEPQSAEICLFELSGRDQQARAKALVEAIERTTGTPAQCGLARSRFVAQHAGRQALVGQVLVVECGEELLAMSGMSLELVPELDQQTRDRLNKLGLTTIGDLVDLGTKRMPKALRELTTTLLRRCQGLDSDPIKPVWPPRSEVAHIAFDDEVLDAIRLEEALHYLATEIAGRLSGGSEFARQVSLTVHFAGGERQVEAEALNVPIADAALLFKTSLRLLKRLHPTKAVTELVLEAQQIAAPRSVQLSLLDSNPGCGFLPYEREQRLSSALRFLGKRGNQVKAGGSLAATGKVGLWTYSLGHVIDEPVAVAIDPEGTPTAVCRRGQSVGIQAVQNEWRETIWQWGACSEHDAFRVLTERGALWELHRLGEQWRLVGLAD